MNEKNKGRGRFHIKHFRDGKLLKEFDVDNATTTVGLNYLLNTAFNSGTAITAWFCGLVDNSGFTGGATADTMSSHAGWAEFVGYAETVRQTWGSGAATTASVTNSSPMVFTINASGTVNGIFVSSSNTKSGTAGTLWNMAAIVTTPLPVLSGDVLDVTYTYSIT